MLEEASDWVLNQFLEKPPPLKPFLGKNVVVSMKREVSIVDKGTGSGWYETVKAGMEILGSICLALFGLK